ncbi:MAG TPA: succinylglutamate desuccinylase/aspartoacylase family protein [Vicinamibacteria bacterium]|nr:succinylglutamate desuccinylase/aspartoacylase family protein [Vicinamibacteria bacterium]
MSSPLTAATPVRDRVIGRIRGPIPGPMLVLVGSIHGNEPAGVKALEGVTRALQLETLSSGDLLALVGNLPALGAGQRFIDEDLNRHWSSERLTGALRTVEDRQRKELFENLSRGFIEARGPIVLLDLHTTSGEGTVFAVFADTLRSRNFARGFPVPAVLGLEEQLEGTLVDYVGSLGHVAVGLEGGQHDDPESIENLASAVWLALGKLEMLSSGARPLAADAHHRLRRATDGVPRIVEVTYRHALDPNCGFRMEPGYRSFHRVGRGQIVARDRLGAVRVPEDGFLLMPLYQAQGDDGFFLVRRVRAMWLHVSAILRYLRLGRVAHWLPGVSRVEGKRHVLEIDRRVARWYSLEVLHLLGFRRRSEEGTTLTVEQRQHDFK